MSTVPIHVQGVGILTSLGRGLAAQVAALREGHCVVGRVPRATGPGDFAFHAIPDGGRGADFYRRIEDVVADAIADADLAPAEVAELGIFIGTSSVDLALREAAFLRGLESSPAPRIPAWGVGQVAEWVAKRFGILGPQFTFTTACSAGANALIYAARLLSAGRLPRALVIGVEHLNMVSLHGFDGMMLLSKTEMRPFDERRDGVVLGEGAGALVLGTKPPRGGGLPRAAFLGAASNIDPDGITCSSPERTGEVMTAALADAGVSSGDVRAVKAHGVSTPAGDRSEALGLRLVFGGHLPPVVSLKPMLGHTLGACAILETASFLGCVQGRFLPATLGFEVLDAEIGLEPVRGAQPVEPGLFLLNHFGFGGNNTALVFAVQP